MAHGPSTLFLHTGATNLVRPSMGIDFYGLGTENENLPAYVSICPMASKGGPRNYGNAFLPSIHQGTAVGRAGSPDDARIRNAKTRCFLPFREKVALITCKASMPSVGQSGSNDGMEATIKNYELAWRMQMEAPELTDLTGETEATKKIYGIGEKATDSFGKQCLLARRMVERGVRYASVNYSDESNNPRWDQHSNMPKHADHTRNTDKPVAGLS